MDERNPTKNRRASWSSAISTVTWDSARGFWNMPHWALDNTPLTAPYMNADDLKKLHLHQKSLVNKIRRKTGMEPQAFRKASPNVDVRFKTPNGIGHDRIATQPDNVQQEQYLLSHNKRRAVVQQSVSSSSQYVSSLVQQPEVFENVSTNIVDNFKASDGIDGDGNAARPKDVQHRHQFLPLL